MYTYNIPSFTVIFLMPGAFLEMKGLLVRSLTSYAVSPHNAKLAWMFNAGMRGFRFPTV